MDVYLPNGFLNFEYIIKSPIPFWFIIGGRAIGKTFGALYEPLVLGHKIIYMRRTQSQTDLINRPEFSPYKAIMREYPEYRITTETITKYNAAIYREGESENKDDRTLIGYTAALSTFSNIRGFDASDCDILIFDEFCPESHERLIKNEASAFLNCVETISRNRELSGRPPLKVICLSNSNQLGNPLFVELRLVRICEKLRNQGEDLYMNQRRGVAVLMPHDSPISRAKKDTSLYKLAGNRSEFGQMALGNEFVTEGFSESRSINIKSLVPLVTVGKVTIYRSKVDGKKYYCSEFRSGNAPLFADNDIDMIRFHNNYSWVRDAYIGNNIVFEDHSAEIYLKKYLDIC